MVNLEIGVWFPQVIHLRQHKFIGPTANFVLKFVNLGLHLLQTFRILAHSGWGVLNIKDNFIELLDLL